MKEHDKVVAHVLSRIKVPNATAVLGGSGAKNTWLHGSTDIDIYVKFNYSKYHKSSDKLSDVLEKHLRKRLKITRLHGSRDYFQTKIRNYTIEIVPILDIKKSSQAKNITDVSQLHVDYVRKHYKLADDIRLAKAFAKAQDVYGAESYIKGFSGYVIELLVIHYNGFENLMKAASRWKGITKIGSKRDIKNLNASKACSPLILIDPVQHDRNAAAALSREKYEHFISACRQYVKSPSERFFIQKKFSLEKLKSASAVILKLSPKKGKKDVVGAKLLKLFEYISYSIEKHGFIIMAKGWHWEKECYFWYRLKEKTISSTMAIKGPPLKLKQHVARFRKKHRKTFVKGSRLCANVKREFASIGQLLKKLAMESHVRKLGTIRKIYK